MRLDRAKQLLLETNWNMERLAERAGMGTAQTLRRLIIEDEGMTPAEFRSRFSARREARARALARSSGERINPRASRP